MIGTKAQSSRICLKWIKTLTVMFMLLCMSAIAAADVGGYAQTGIDRFDHSYETKMTGDPAQDIVIIAQAQLGKNGASLGYTGNWCAAFVTDCARYAGVPDLMPFVSGCTHACGGFDPNHDGLYEYMLKAGATEVSIDEARAGDIVFFRKNTETRYGHVAIVAGSNATVEGNMNGWGDSTVWHLNSSVTNYVISNRYTSDPEKIYFTHTTVLRPNYPPASRPGTPVISTNKDIYILGETATVTLTNTSGSSSQYLQFYHKDSGTYLYNSNSTGVFTHQFELTKPGTYKVLYQTTNSFGSSDPVSKEITVLEKQPTPVINLPKNTYIIGEPVTFTLSGTEGSDSQYLQVKIDGTEEYLYNQNSNGVFSHQFVIDKPGTYAILYAATNKQLGTASAEKKLFTVTDVLPVPVIETDKEVYSLGESVNIRLSNVEGSTRQNMQFVHLDSNTYLYNGASTGTFDYSFPLAAIGTYKILYHASNTVASFEHVSKIITVTSDLAIPTISTERDTYVIGEPITITLGNVAGSVSQYMQFRHIDSGEYLYNQVSTGVYTHQFTVSKPGTYKVLYQATYSSGSSDPVEKYITVNDTLPVPTITTDKEVYTIGDTVTITFGNTEGSTSQYMQFRHIESNEYLYNKNSNGIFVHQFVVTEPGTYKILYQASNPLLSSEPVEKIITVAETAALPTQITLSASGTVRCRAGDKLQAAAETDIPDNLIWRSSDTSVASVDAQGIITISSNGQATIFAAAESNPACSASFIVKASHTASCMVLPKSLKTIDRESFFGNSAITMLILPETDELAIGKNAFTGCSSLTSVYTGKNALQIGEGCFPDTETLTFLCYPDSAAYHYAIENGVNYLLRH